MELLLSHQPYKGPNPDDQASLILYHLAQNNHLKNFYAFLYSPVHLYS